jgi:alpha-L-fucosidase
MDWHHPDGARCAQDEAARRRFVDYIHGQVREICTQYGKLDILWYDVAWPLDAPGWESDKMNRMVREILPDVIINNRAKVPEDFDTPEQRIVASQRPWEACMTMNDSWGYQRADDDWKSPKTIIRNLVTCARDGGNYLLNIGPLPDGSIPPESVSILTEVGKWTDKYGETIHGAERCRVRVSNFCNFTRKGNTLYVHAHFYPGDTIAIGGLRTKVRSAKLLPSGTPVRVEQDDFRLRLLGLPEKAPDLVPVIALECESEPVQDMDYVRRNRKRYSA